MGKMDLSVFMVERLKFIIIYARFLNVDFILCLKVLLLMLIKKKYMPEKDGNCNLVILQTPLKPIVRTDRLSTTWVTSAGEEM